MLVSLSPASIQSSLLRFNGGRSSGSKNIDELLANPTLLNDDRIRRVLTERNVSEVRPNGNGLIFTYNTGFRFRVTHDVLPNLSPVVTKLAPNGMGTNTNSFTERTVLIALNHVAVAIKRHPNYSKK